MAHSREEDEEHAQAADEAWLASKEPFLEDADDYDGDGDEAKMERGE